MGEYFAWTPYHIPLPPLCTHYYGGGGIQLSEKKTMTGTVSVQYGTVSAKYVFHYGHVCCGALSRHGTREDEEQQESGASQPGLGCLLTARARVSTHIQD